MYGGITMMDADMLESVTPTVSTAQEEPQELDEQYLEEQRKLQEAVKKAEEDHLAKLDQ